MVGSKSWLKISVYIFIYVRTSSVVITSYNYLHTLIQRWVCPSVASHRTVGVVVSMCRSCFVHDSAEGFLPPSYHVLHRYRTNLQRDECIDWNTSLPFCNTLRGHIVNIRAACMHILYMSQHLYEHPEIAVLSVS